MIQGRNNMQMIDVLKRLEELDATNPNVVKEEKKKSSKPVQLEEGLDTSSLKMLAGTQSITECGMPTLGAPMPSMTPPMPASLNMSAGNASEIVQMVRGLMDLAKTDAPTQSPFPALGAPMPDLGIPHHEPIIDEPTHDAMNAPAIPDVKGMDAPEIGMDKDKGPTDLDVAGDQEIMDLIKKIRTGEPVKVTTDQNVKVKTTDPIKGSTTDKHTSSDNGSEEDEGWKGGVVGGAVGALAGPEGIPVGMAVGDKVGDWVSGNDKEDEGVIGGLIGGAAGAALGGPVGAMTGYSAGSKAGDDLSGDDKKEDEGFRGYDNSPKEKVKKYDPNSMADLRDKVSVADKEYTPPGSGSNPLPKADKKKEESLSFEEALFNEYKKFVNEAKEKCCCAEKSKKKCPVHGKEMDESTEKETMSKAGKGVMKYGKDGMKALAKAGKKGKDLDKVRDKYNKYD